MSHPATEQAIEAVRSLLCSLGAQPRKAEQGAAMICVLLGRESDGVATATMPELFQAAGIGKSVGWPLRNDLERVYKLMETVEAPRGGKHDGTTFKVSSVVFDALPANVRGNVRSNVRSTSGDVSPATSDRTLNQRPVNVRSTSGRWEGDKGVANTYPLEKNLAAAAARIEKSTSGTDEPQRPDVELAGNVRSTSERVTRLEGEVARLASLVVQLQGSIQSLRSKGRPAGTGTAALSPENVAKVWKAARERLAQAMEGGEPVRSEESWLAMRVEEYEFRLLTGDVALVDLFCAAADKRAQRLSPEAAAARQEEFDRLEREKELEIAKREHEALLARRPEIKDSPLRKRLLASWAKEARQL